MILQVRRPPLFGDESGANLEHGEKVIFSVVGI
jgi:hypothetical protein